MKFTTGSVMTIKLNSGEELIAKVTSTPDENGFITIEEPVSIAPAQNGMQMIPSMFTAEPGSPVTLNTNNISMSSVTEDGIKMKYIEATTGIRIPEKKIIKG
jgi:hypothetical protein